VFGVCFYNTFSFLVFSITKFLFNIGFMMRFNLPLACFLLIVLFAACVPLHGPLLTNSWVYADLRNLDPADSPLPGQDLIAVYTRATGEELQVRLDFLDLALIPDFDLFLALDTMPGGRRDLPLEVAADLGVDVAEDARPRIVAHTTVAVLRAGLSAWFQGGCEGDPAKIVAETFDRATPALEAVLAMPPA